MYETDAPHHIKLRQLNVVNKFLLKNQRFGNLVYNIQEEHDCSYRTKTVTCSMTESVKHFT